MTAGVAGQLGLAGVLGPRDPALPLLTWLDGLARVELSGATSGNWVAKTANLLSAAGSPTRVGLLLPLHWQAVTLLLGAVASGATAVFARDPADLAGCDTAFVTVGHAAAALDACEGDVLAVSTAPLGGRLTGLPALVLDAGAELPAYGDLLEVRPPRPGAVELAGARVTAAPGLGVGPPDRVLTCLPPADPVGLAVGLLAPLAAGSALVLAAAPDPAAVADERVTASVGCDVAGARRLA